MKKKLLIASALLLSALTTLKAQTASIQVINNSADTTASTLDIYAGSTLLINDLKFRYSSQTYNNIPVNNPIIVNIAQGTSTSVSQAFATFTLNLTAGSRNVIILDGIISNTGYTPSNSVAPFTLTSYSAGLAAAPNATTTSILIHHGSTDVPTIDVVSPFQGTNPTIPNSLVDNISYSNFSNGYVNLPTANYKIQIRDEYSENVAKEYNAKLSNLGLGGAAVTIVASGFLTPANNSNGASFGLFAATSAAGPLTPLPSTSISSTRLQTIHNSADASLTQVDIWVQSTTAIPNPILMYDNLKFRAATPYLDVPAGETVTITVAPATSTSPASAISTQTQVLNASSKYQVISGGIISASGYTPNNTNAPFKFFTKLNVRERALIPTNTDLLFFNGITDAPPANIIDESNTPLATNMAYGNFNSSGYQQLPNATYTLQATNTAGTNTLATFFAPLNSLGLTGKAVTVLASGFLNSANNSNGPAFGLWAALPTGGDLIQFPTLTVTNISEHSVLHDVISVYPNPFSNQIQIKNTASAPLEISIIDLNGKLLLSQNFSLLEASIDVTELKSGLYFIRVTDGNSTATYKLTK